MSAAEPRAIATPSIPGLCIAPIFDSDGCCRLDRVSNPHVRFELHPDLERPAVVVAIRGWNDGGEAASIAARYLIERWDGALIATLDPEEFVDFQVTRPTVRLEDGVSRVI